METAPNPLTLELEAMAVVGQILCDLPDQAARQRVLKWAAERFAAERELALTAPEAAPAPAQETSGDPALAIDSLNDMFADADAEVDDDDLGEFAVPARSAPPAASAPPPGLEVVIRSFAEDFQRFVDEWNGATA